MTQTQPLKMILGALSAKYPTTSNALKIVGFLLVLRKILYLLEAGYRNMIDSKKDLLRRYGRGSWAFVTGSSEGIGKAIAMSLAKRGFNIVLSARTEYKLHAAKVHIMEHFPSVEVLTLVVDYSRSTEDGYLSHKMEQIKHLDISILVNNVGYGSISSYHSFQPGKLNKIININCASGAILSHIFIDRFRKRHQNKNKRCAIVNISSLAAQFPQVYHNIYSASKAFVDILSRSLSYEYRRQMDILSVRPSEVTTPMTLNKNLGMLTIMPYQCAEGLLQDLGRSDVTNGYWTHKLQSIILSAFPERALNYIWGYHVAPDFIEERERLQKRD